MWSYLLRLLFEAVFEARSLKTIQVMQKSRPTKNQTMINNQSDWLNRFLDEPLLLYTFLFYYYKKSSAAR